MTTAGRIDPVRREPYRGIPLPFGAHDQEAGGNVNAPT